MSLYFLLVPVLLPILGALALTAKCFQGERLRRALVLSVCVATSALLLACVVRPPEGSLTLLALTGSLSLTLAFDGLSRLFALILAVLWPLTAIYAFDYLRHDEKKSRFFAFFLLSYGAAAGITVSGNLTTLYLFFESLTLATLPLVMHKMDDEARYAGKRYLLYSMSGAALGFIAVVFAALYGTGAPFTLGGTLSPALVTGKETLLRAVFTVAFFGFAVKAALFPLCAWLPAASVAPTPVTALLHAVAVVKAGAFACIRLSYYCFGTELVAGGFSQYLPMGAAIVTIALGSLAALRSNHLKRRLAWSTVSNLSYILFGVTLFSGAGLLGAGLHMLYHAFIKITLFFAVGQVMERAGKSYLDEIEGLGRAMPVTFACFAAASLALMGVPPFCGFFSKWQLLTAATAQGSFAAFAGIGALILSALLTALYQCGTLTHAFFPLGGSVRTKGPARLETAGMTSVIAATTLAVATLSVLSPRVSALLAAWLS